MLHDKFLPPGVSGTFPVLESSLTHEQTIVHTSAYLLNRHRLVWGPDGNEFKPSRWLNAGSKNLDRYMVTFYRGSRQCLGQE